mmetsp:Transcript_65657/g.182697  ORF Transcript_65657/g.182697 Transcript_65657/m.182697 type:complete len:203 (+) Transcript_65657:229-837(+)
MVTLHMPVRMMRCHLASRSARIKAARCLRTPSCSGPNMLDANWTAALHAIAASFQRFCFSKFMAKLTYALYMSITPFSPFASARSRRSRKMASACMSFGMVSCWFIAIARPYIVASLALLSFFITSAAWRNLSSASSKCPISLRTAPRLCRTAESSGLACNRRVNFSAAAANSIGSGSNVACTLASSSLPSSSLSLLPSVPG